ncbi:MAG: ATP-binding protein [Oscillospiraceae bacterium]|nr:ATP-binding protein [Oscillospiraceae bacterium]
MGYSREVYDDALRTLSSRRAEAAARAAARRERLIAAYPRIGEIERELAGCAPRVARAVLAGEDAEAAVGQIKEHNLALQKELAKILHGAGETRHTLAPEPVCALCHDTGYVDGAMCDCLRDLLKEEAKRRLRQSMHMPLTDFEQVRTLYYKGQYFDHMKAVVAYCRAWAEDFRADSGSLLLRGRTGLGKTFLSLAMAGAVSDKGFSVIYGPAHMLLAAMEKEQFARDGSGAEHTLLHADLLILDDLGTEFGGSFAVSALYTLINGRMLEHHPTIVSTNCDNNALLDKYGEALVSRLLGEFETLTFKGTDIRQMKKAE